MFDLTHLQQSLAFGQQTLPDARGDVPDWELLRAGCAKLWPELMWIIDKSDHGRAHVYGRKKRKHQTIVNIFWWSHSSRWVTMTVAPTRPLPPPWHVHISTEIALDKIENELPLRLADGRRWWGDDQPKKDRKRGSSS